MLPDPTTFLVLAGAVNRFVELLKPTVKKLGYSDDIYNFLLILIACVLGILLAFIAGGVNIVPAILPVPAIVGVTLTGVIIGLGADAVNAVLDLLYSWQKPSTPVVTTSTPAPAGTATKVDVTTSTPAS